MLSISRSTKTKVLYLLFIVIILMCADCMYTTFAFKLETLTKLNLLNNVMDGMGMIICVIIYGSILLDKRGSGDENSLLLLTFFIALILFCDSVNWTVDGQPGHSTTLWLANFGLFILILLIIAMFWSNTQKDLDIPENVKHGIDIFLLAMIAIGTVNALLTYFTGWVFTVNDAGFYERGKHIIISNIPALFMLLTVLFAFLKYGNSTRRKLTACSYTILPIIATLLQLCFYGISFIYFTISVCMLLMYSNIYVTRGTDTLTRDRDLTEKRFQIMYSQIQPHFLYNSLTSIMNIKGNPQETVDAIADFGKYLRGNLETLSCKRAIPFRAEFEHLEIYVDLEKRRFKKKMNVVYDIQDNHFFLPSLTIQMLVENAVRHGITMKEEGGTIIVRTYCDDTAHYVYIEDDGVGFNTEILEEDNECIGISNVRSRLADMVNGKLEIESTIGVGTRVLITIPRAKSQTVG